MGCGKSVRFLQTEIIEEAFSVGSEITISRKELSKINWENNEEFGMSC